MENIQSPPRSFLNDDKFTDLWSRMDPALQAECLRAERELLRGKAIYQDQMAGRPKKDPSGFYALQLLEEEIYHLEQVPRKAKELEEARKRAAALKTGLDLDRARVKQVLARNQDLEPFEDAAKASGTTIADYLREMTSLEQHLKEDPLGAFIRIGDRIGVDFLSVLVAAKQSEARH